MRRWRGNAFAGRSPALAESAFVERAEDGTLEGLPILDVDVSMTTIMGNLLVRAPTGNVQPYGSGGVGLMRLSLSADVPIIGEIRLGSVQSNELAWNAGRGVVFFAGDRVGIRADVWSFRAFDTTLDLTDLSDFDIDDIDRRAFTSGA